MIAQILDVLLLDGRTCPVCLGNTRRALLYVLGLHLLDPLILEDARLVHPRIRNSLRPKELQQLLLVHHFASLNVVEDSAARQLAELLVHVTRELLFLKPEIELWRHNVSLQFGFFF